MNKKFFGIFLSFCMFICMFSAVIVVGAADCTHKNTVKTWETVTPSTCSSTGTEKEVCSCGKDTGVTRSLPVNADAHAAVDFVWRKTGDTYYYGCTACKTRIAEQTTLPTVYVDAYSKADANIGSDDASGTANDEVFTLEEAVRRLAKVGGTVCMTDRYYISGVVTLPAYDKPITITSLINGKSGKTGFYVKTTSRLVLGGETTFKNIYFFSETTTVRQLSFDCGWNNVTFGDDIATGVEASIVAGGTNVYTNDTANKDVTITVSGVKQYVNGNGEEVAFETVPTFYSKIFIGNRITSASNMPEGGCTVSNKKVTFEVIEGIGYPELGDVYLITSSPVSTPLVKTLNCETTVTLNGTTTIKNLYSGFKNTDGGEGYLDRLTLNLNDNSDVVKYAGMRNIKHVTMNVSSAKDGRTVKAKAPNFTKSTVYAPTGDESLVANYGSHSFSNVELLNGFVQGTQYNAMYSGRVTVNIADECTWDNGKITTAATATSKGVKTYTCSVCGGSKTESVPMLCTSHTYVTDTSGAYSCAKCGESVTAPKGNTIYVSSSTVSGGVATVVISARIDKLICAGFSVKYPDGFTLNSVENTSTTDFTFVNSSKLTANPYKTYFINLGYKDSAINAEIAVLKFKVESTVKDGDYNFTVDVIEAYKVDESSVAVTGVGRKLTFHTHSYQAIATAPTCTNAGYTTYTCACGYSYVEQGSAATGHVNTITKTVDATCLDKGSVSVICACGHVVSTKTVAALGHAELILSGVAPTCTEAGLTAGSKCDRCWKILVEQTVAPAIGHTEVEMKAVEPTCAKTGLTAGVKCGTCGEILVKQNVVAAKGHTYKATVTAPTCTSEGYTTYKCSCGDSYVADKTPVIGHAYDDGVVDPQPKPNVPGIKTFTCANCGDTYTEEVFLLEGDIDSDGAVTVKDVILLLRYLADGIAFENGDIDGDGKIGLIDVIRVLSIAVQ